jgi:hypothetical protein
MMFPIVSVGWSVLLLALFAGSASAQDKVYRLEPRKVSDIPQGKAVMINGKTGPRSHRFLLDQLTVYTPVVVTLRAARKEDDVRLKIGKTSWEQTLREGSSRGAENNQVSFNFRTEGEFLISVEGTKPDLPYKLLVWVGDEVNVEPPPAVVPKSQLTNSDASWLSGGVVMWVIAAALLGIFSLLLIMVSRRKA